ncbi:hypothetical protein QQS21_001105 [Conoideocrella luteorostrata]|uniref:Gag1-like clamp domain-containing protein n=1 Tax=Conoideocrella luteorostrata TaxID=1105319 RepID=A0AAJ0G228_9HYPO|nr:hypothetical protein QQS21_001105 [Conoideocrella luteorostrata]
MIVTGTASCGETIGRHTRTNNHLELESEAEENAAMVQNEPNASLTREAHTAAESTKISTMIFSDFYRNPRSPLSKLRMHHPQLPAHLLTATPEWVSEDYADLMSRDKAKQKEAVRRYLTDKVRNDWAFPWPPLIPEEKSVSGLCRKNSTIDVTCENISFENNGSHLIHSNERDYHRKDGGTEFGELESSVDEGDVDDDNDDAESVYSVFSEDAMHYRPRMEWMSDLSDDDAEDDLPTKSLPVRIDGSNAVQSTSEEIVEAKKARRRRALREETSWNDGLACYEARRNAWTGARTVRVRGKPVITPSTSPRSPRRFFFRRSMSGSPPGPAFAVLSHHGDITAAISDTSSVGKDTDKGLQKHLSIDSSASNSTHRQTYPVEILLPLGQPLLPPSNPLRASISPTVYLSLYDKVILHNLQPACPINLSDMLRSCVAGWKRDGEWPPRPSAPEPMTITRKKKKTTSSANEQTGNVARRMSFGLLGRDNHDDSNTGKGIRRSLQRALGIGVMADMDS